MDSRIIPNGRRDYFERDPHLRNLENHLSPIIGRITGRSQTASSSRNKEKRLASAIGDIEDMYELAASGCLAANDAESFVKKALKSLEKIYQDMGSVSFGNEPIERLSVVEANLRNFYPNGNSFPLASVSPSEVDTYQKVFGAVAGSAPSPRSAREIIDAVLKGLDN